MINKGKELICLTLQSFQGGCFGFYSIRLIHENEVNEFP